jgi:hypothetical protein
VLPLPAEAVSWGLMTTSSAPVLKSRGRLRSQFFCEIPSPGTVEWLRINHL